VRVEIYRIFPNDSDVNRTSGSPTFSTPLVPTRVNSPSDVDFADRSVSANTLTAVPGIISPSFTAKKPVHESLDPRFARSDAPPHRPFILSRLGCIFLVPAGVGR
jgi:hypothetical protein